MRGSAEAIGARHALPRLVLAIGLLVCVAQPAAAHVPQLRGRLIDLVSQSDLVVVGTVEDVRAVGPQLNDTTVRVEGQFIGEATDAPLTFRARPPFAPGQRFVFFLHRDGASLSCVQPVGTVFPSRPQDDAAYRQTITAVQRALPAVEGERAAALRAAIIPALSAAAPPLRYHAVLELAALAHHGLTEAERRALEQLATDPATDPAIRPILVSLLRTAAAAQSEAGGPRAIAPCLNPADSCALRIPR